MHRASAPGKAVQAGTAEARAQGEVSLRQACRDYVWLYDRRRGVTTAEIAAREGLCIETVYAGLRRARELDARAAELLEAEADLKPPDLAPGLLPLFPIGALTPRSECPHRGPITPGTSLCCMVCHASGFDAVGVGQGRAAPVP